MLRKRDQYLAGYAKSMSNSQATASDEMRQLWSHVADAYRTLIEFEDRHPTQHRGSIEAQGGASD